MPKYESQADVIRAIKRASDEELRALADISRHIKNVNGGGGGLRYVKASNAGKYRQPAANQLGAEIERITGGRAPTRINSSAARKTRQIVQKAIDDGVEVAAAAVADALVEGAKKQRGKAPSGHYYDNAGRLRDSSGKYASKEANEKARSNRSGKGSESAETNAMLKKMLTNMGRGAANATSGTNGDTAANAAGMGVMWQASKELAGMVQGATKNTVAMSAFINDGRKAITRTIKRGFGANDARASAKENKEIAAAAASKTQHKDAVDTHSNQERQIALLEEIAHKVGAGGAGAGGTGLFGKIASGLAGGLGKMGLGFLVRGGKGVGKLLGRGGKAAVSLAGKASAGAANLVRRGVGAVGSKLGIPALASVGEAVAAKNTGKVATAVAEKGAEKLAKGSMVKAGGSLLEKGALKGAAKIGLRAIPIVGTIGGMAYDAYAGATDDDQLHKTFGNGPITGRQRTAAAVANVADLGGLVSGLSNVMASAMTDFGWGKAADFFSMDGSTGLAHKLDDLIGEGSDKAEALNDKLLEKLGEIVTGVNALTVQGKGVLSDKVADFVSDTAKVTASAGPTVTETVYDANGALNKSRLAKGMSVNPIAQIQTSGSSKAVNNNNPGNLRFANQAGAVAEANWKPNYKGDTPFAAFATPEQGVRAFGNQLMTYQKRDKLNTLSDIVQKYAPKSDHNNTAAYIAQVSKKTGIGANDTLDTTDPAIMAKLVAAFGQHEGGFSMSEADIKTALGTVQNGRYVGGFTKETTEQLKKTPAGRAILENGTGAKGGAPAPVTAAPKEGIPVTAGGWVAGKLTAAQQSINNAAISSIPGLKYSGANAQMGLGGVNRTQIAPMLNGDALVGKSPTNTLPTRATLATSSGGGIISGALSDVWNQATGAVSGQGIMQHLTHGMSPAWQYMLNPLINAAGGGIDKAVQVVRNGGNGIINGSSAYQPTVTNLAANGATGQGEQGASKAADDQVSLLQQLVDTMEEMLGIQKKPKGDADKPVTGPEPSPSGDIPLTSSSHVMNTVLRRNQ